MPNCLSMDPLRQMVTVCNSLGCKPEMVSVSTELNVLGLNFVTFPETTSSPNEASPSLRFCWRLKPWHSKLSCPPHSLQYSVISSVPSWFLVLIRRFLMSSLLLSGCSSSVKTWQVMLFFHRQGFEDLTALCFFLDVIWQYKRELFLEWPSSSSEI